MISWISNKLPFSVKLAIKRLLLWTKGSAHQVSTYPLAPVASPEPTGLATLLASNPSRLSNPSQARNIKTSIIIPVFNKAEFTYQCLRSLRDVLDFEQTEIIIVNNASSDETSRLLEYFKEYVQIIDNRENLGFVDASNQGARSARGDYLVFLNNDTIVASGWLDSLLETIESDNSVGAVGSLFLYPGGMIQEAGGIIWNSGEAFHYGWGKSGNESKYLFAREVDYCSGASLLIRKNLFDRLGGFDRRYAPAYYEDVDLCFGVRSLGYKVIYQPASRVIHFEGATAGRDVNRGVKQYQVINRAKFKEKWQQVLARDHFENDLKYLEAAANRTVGPDVIVFDDRIPTPDRDAGSARMFWILKTLSRHARTVFVYKSNPLASDYLAMLWKERVETASIAHYPSLLKRRNFLVAIISRPDIAKDVLPSVRRRARRIRIIFDMVDAHYLRLDLEFQITGDNEVKRQADRYRKMELELVRASDLVWCNSSEDEKSVAAEVRNIPIKVIPTIHPLRARGKQFSERKNLLFIGNFNHRPNRDGLRFFLEEVLPLIRESIPQVEISIIGGNIPSNLLAFQSNGVKFLGYVPEVDRFFHEARVFVAPLRFGAGVKGKIGDALSFGLPVVTTSVGAAGMGFENGNQALIGDEPEAFAHAVIRAYDNPVLWQRLSDNGYEHVKRYFSPEVVERTILASLKDLSPTMKGSC